MGIAKSEILISMFFNLMFFDFKKSIKLLNSFVMFESNESNIFCECSFRKRNRPGGNVKWQ